MGDWERRFLFRESAIRRLRIRRAPMGKWKRRFQFAGLLLFVLYVGSYLVLSRRGYAEADRWNMKGFYYFTPEPSARWRFMNYACVDLYRPLNVVDRWLGFGRPPGCEPLWGLSL